MTEMPKLGNTNVSWLFKTDFWFSSTSLQDWLLFMSCFYVVSLSLLNFPLAAFTIKKMVVILIHTIITMTEVLHPVYVTISQAILRPGDATGCCSVAAKCEGPVYRRESLRCRVSLTQSWHAI
ncbi:hypothetical protein Bca4012_037176 [Brassica carinata]